MPEIIVPGETEGVPADATVVVRDLHIRYRVAGPRPSARDVIARRTDRVNIKEVHAVKGLDLIARKGEAIGLIGANGAGKSTALRAIAGVLPATSGEVHCSSQPVLLGVRAAMEPKLTGRQNIELGCFAIGMTRRQTETRFDRIVRFSDLGDAIERPMETYSSGMKARLLFAIATEIKPEILLIDEALSVGDERFQRKSRNRVRNMLAEAGTVFIVSHSMRTMLTFSTRILWIDDGRVVLDGEPAEVIEAYRVAQREGDDFYIPGEDDDDLDDAGADA